MNYNATTNYVEFLKFCIQFQALFTIQKKRYD